MRVTSHLDEYQLCVCGRSNGRSCSLYGQHPPPSAPHPDGHIVCSIPQRCVGQGPAEYSLSETKWNQPDRKGHIAPFILSSVLTSLPLCLLPVGDCAPSWGRSEHVSARRAWQDWNLCLHYKSQRNESMTVRSCLFTLKLLIGDDRVW
jgi:hypothetical protein